MTEKIMQIIPAPLGMTALYEGGAPEIPGTPEPAVCFPVSCLALVECSAVRDTGAMECWQEVRAMVASDQQDALDFAGEHDGFITVQHEGTL